MKLNSTFLWKGIEDASKIWHAFISYDSPSDNTKKKINFFENKSGDDVEVVQCPFNAPIQQFIFSYALFKSFKKI